jgi:hypothetical protein
MQHNLERCPSGRRGSPAKGVWALTPIEGSNPSFSAKIKHAPLWGVFYWEGIEDATKLSGFNNMTGQCFVVESPI